MAGGSGGISDWKIKTKLLVAFGVMIVLIVASSVMGTGAAMRMSDYLQTLYDDRFDHIIELSEMQREMASLRAGAYQTALSGDPDAQRAMQAASEDRLARIATLMDLCEDHCQRTDAMKAYAGMAAAWEQFRQGIEKVYQGAVDGQSTEALLAAADAVEPAYRDLSDRAWSMSQAQDRLGRQLYNNAIAVYEVIRAAGVVGVVLSLVIGFGFVAWLSRTVSRPILDMTNAMNTLAQHETGVHIPGSERGDEIGAMSRAVSVFKDNMIKADQLAADQDKERAKRETRTRRIEELNTQFDKGVSGIIGSVSAAATQLQSTAESMSTIAEETETQSTTVAAASEEASTNVQTVSSAAEELSASIQEISRQVSQASDISRDATHKVEETNRQIESLNDAAKQIGEVVALITDIADQTNLLALNATIEAARAGEAGKGFAVVANEVKNLANQTAKATEDIANRISSVQAETESAVLAVRQIGDVVRQVTEISQSIASAVEEQNAATGEIARNVEQAAAGTQEVSSNIQGVTQAAGEAGNAADQVVSAVGELSTQSDKLKQLVETFLDDVRKA